MDILKNFGVNPILLVAQVINFLIIFFILKKFLYKPVLDILKKRQITIRNGIKQAEEARIRLEKVVIEEKNILRQAQLAAKKIIEDSRAESIEITKEMNDKAKKQTEKMIGNAREQITRESMEAEKRLAVSTAKLAVSFLQNSLKEFFSAEEQKEVLSNALKTLRPNAD